jgi:2'-5' RNA ligase
MTIKDNSLNHYYLLPHERLEFPIKVNIHFPIRGSLHHDCIECNKKISEITKNEVSFDPTSFQIPHITLYMGFVENIGNLKLMLEATETYSRSIKPLEIQVSQPYISKPQNNWVFLDVQPSETIKTMKRDIQQTTGKYISPLSWDVVGGIPHITLGYVKHEQKIVEEMLSTAELTRTSLATAIEVSFGGARGSCLGSIKTFELI